MMILQRSPVLGAVSILLLTSGIALAQLPARPIAVESKSAPAGAHSPTAELGSPVFRASQLKGIKVENRAGEEVGKIYDLVIDPRSGKTAYIALSVGGCLHICSGRASPQPQQQSGERQSPWREEPSDHSSWEIH
jgi:sporulation protein YlmC with PRC-barrel domain